MAILENQGSFIGNRRLTPEFRLVIACSWLPANKYLEKQNDVIESLTKCSLNWDEIASLVQRHGDVGQFCAAMSRAGWVKR